MNPEHHQLQLFDHAHLRCSALRPSEKGTTHWIGGKFSDYGFECNDDGARLIYAIDQRDQQIAGIIPGLDIIPVCYGFGTIYSDNGSYVYQIENNQIIRVTPRAGSFEYTYENFPQSFERFPLEVFELDVDLSNAEDAMNYVAVFGLRHLDEKQMILATESIRHFYEDPPENLPIHELNMPIEEFVHHLWEPFWQDKPSANCQNPECDSTESLTTVALLSDHPHPKVRIWDDSFDHADVQLAVQYCPECSCITTSNQCG